MTTPSWLDPATEIVNNDQPQAYKALDDITKSIVFILTSYKALKQANPILTPQQNFWIIGNAIAETGWGRLWRGYNFGGWKITKDFATSFKKANGRSARWWQAQGHVNSGDEPIVYYRGYENPSQFYIEWLTRFVPQAASSTHRYAKTGAAFWKPEDSWFRELCLAGYKGAVTQANPDKSIESWKQVLKLAEVRVAQYLLKVKVDGAWGPRSQAACDAFARQKNLPTGKLTIEIVAALIDEWEKQGSVLPASL